MSGGGKIGSAIQQLDSLYSKCYNRGMSYEEYKVQALQWQVYMFKAGYDDSPFHEDEAKVLSRGEYVARWYQIYYGGEPNSTKFAKFLIEEPEGQRAIDDIINNGR